jgi:hypothetical protein
VIFGGFAIANPLDRGAAEVGLKGPDYRGFPQKGDSVFHF